MLSLLGSIEESLQIFFLQLTNTLGFGGYLGLFLGVEALFVLLFVIKSAFSYEKRLKRRLEILNNWLLEKRQINEDNITEFNKLVKKGPRRLVYHWQQYILYREGNPSKYMNEVNLIEKPLKTSGFKSNIRNLTVLSLVWGLVAAVFGIASQMTSTLTPLVVAVGLTIPMLVGILGGVAIIFLRSRRTLNLDDIYHLYHYFARFVDGACAELTPFIDFDLLFTAKEIERGNVHLREYYEARTRQAKKEFENAAKTDKDLTKYNFEEVGIDGAVLLERAMSESEKYINKKRDTASEIARIDAQKEALRRNYEAGQMDLQRKIQATKENIAKLIEQQAATTSRVEVGLLRNQQEKEVAKQASLQRDYDKEEARYNASKEELDAAADKLRQTSEEGLDEAKQAMESEYRSFLEKVMKSVTTLADKKSENEKLMLKNEVERNEEELANVQTQIKRLKDENDTLKALLENQKVTLRSMLEEGEGEIQSSPEGHYDENGNYVYSDGSFHDTQGLFHDVDGKVYNMNGELVSQDEDPEETKRKEEEKLKREQINQFGSYVSEDNRNAPKVEPYNPELEESNSEPKIEAYNPDEEDGFAAAEFGQKKEDLEKTESFYQIRVQKEEEPKEGKKKRGRPKKEKTAQKDSPSKGKRGRPKKVEKSGLDKKVEKESANKKPGRPKKTQEEKTVQQRKTRGRPRKLVKKVEEVEKTKRKPGRPKKEITVGDMNELINEISKNMDESKRETKNKLNQALKNSGNDKEKDQEDALKQFEKLKKQIEQAKKKGISESEAAKINRKLDELIKKMTSTR